MYFQTVAFGVDKVPFNLIAFLFRQFPNIPGDSPAAHDAVGSQLGLKV